MTKGIGVDIGTMNLVAARQEGGRDKLLTY